MNYKEIFRKIEHALKRNLFISQEEFNKRAEWFNKLDFRKLNNDEIFWILTYVVFYSGFKAVTIESKLPQIKKYLYGYDNLINKSEDEIQDIIKIIGFKRKVLYTLNNAKKFHALINEFDSFEKYVNSFGIYDLTPELHSDSLSKLYWDLQKFSNIGTTTAYHFLADLGFKVIKPDLVIRRIFYRLGFIDSPNDYKAAVDIGREFTLSTKKNSRYIDIILVKYGHIGRSEILGTKNGICLETNPHCKLCELPSICKYYAQNFL